jgi:deoxyribonuclease-1-like protein
MRTIPFYPLLIVLLVGLGGYLGCDPNHINTAVNPVSNTASSQIQQSLSVPPRTSDRVLIGSFNIKRLGPSKARQTEVMQRLAQIVLQFDVIAIQEVTDKSGLAIQELLSLVNQTGAQYALAMSNAVGRASTGYFEQYAFIFDTNRIAGGKDFCYLVDDKMDLLHREPYVGRFETKSPNPFGFSLINVHTDPDEVVRELDVLADLFVVIRNYEYQQCGHDDVILLGDLNAGPGKLRRLEGIPAVGPVITMPTNTARTQTYDNFIMDRGYTTEFTGKAGVIDLQSAFGINLADAQQISDHLPIWAEFTATRNSADSNTTMSASRPTAVLR